MAFISGLLVTQFLITILAIFAAVYFYFKTVLYNYWKKKGIVYVEPTTPFGNLGDVVKGKLTIGELYADAYATHKSNPYFGMYTFYKPSLVIVDPDIIRHVLTKDFLSFHDRGVYSNEQVDPLSGHLFVLPGSKWRNLRVKLTPTFTSGKMKKMFMTMAECGDRVTQYLEPKAEKREIIEMKELFARFGTDVIMSAAFGVSCDSINNPDSEFRHWGAKALDLKPIMTALLFFGPSILKFFSLSTIDKGVNKFFTNAFKETVTYREANNISRNDFLDLLMQLMKRGYVDADDDEDKLSIADVPEGKITMLEAAAQAFVFFLAGFEATSSTITYCLYELSLNQDIQDKVTKDIDSALEKCGGLTYESIQKMTYLHKVVSETLRKRAPLPLLNRQCTKDIVLPSTNLHIDRGTDVVVSVWGLHRDPNIYPDPDKFDPERFNEENIAARHPYAYMPFGEGPRICIGARFSYTQIKVGIISVLAKYRVKPAPATPATIDYDPGNIVMVPKHGLELIVELR